MPKENVNIERNRDTQNKEDEIQSLFSKGTPLKIDDTEQKKLVKAIEEEFEEIKKERKDINGCDYDSFLETADRQRRGEMPKSANRAYNLDTKLSKIKCNDIIRTTVDAIFGVDPLVSVNPRPGYAKGVGATVCQEQEEYLDYVLDEKIPLKKPIRLAAQSAAYKKVGVIKWVHKVKKEKRLRHEKFVGKNEILGVDQQGQPIVRNKALDDFLLSYGDIIEKDKQLNPKSTKYDWIVKNLTDEKTVEFDIEYEEVVYNDPFPIFVDNSNFYVRKDVDGYEGLCETRLIVERKSYTYHELKRFEKEYDFVNVDKLIYDDGEDKPREGFASEKYDVLECRFQALLPGKDDYTKVICFISEDKMMYLGGIYWPYTVIDCDYVPHYMTETDTGFYQEAPAEDLRDSHLAKNAILNHTLESAQIANTITPITPRDSDVAEQFLTNTWVNGYPLYADPNELDFVNNRMRPPDVASLLVLDQSLSRLASDISGVSDLRSGKETPLDPNAPGNKTIALLNESGKNVKDYVNEFIKGFAIDAKLILRMYYEMNQDEQYYYERRYRNVTGAEPKKISKSAMISSTRIQSQAMSYDFNKINAKKEDLALNAFLVNESMIINNPQANYERIKLIMSSWSPKWKNSIEKILPSPQEFQQQQFMVALQAVQMYVQAKVTEAQVKGQPPQMIPEELIQMISQMQAQATMPVKQAQEIQKSQERAEKKGK